MLPLFIYLKDHFSNVLDLIIEPLCKRKCFDGKQVLSYNQPLSTYSITYNGEIYNYLVTLQFVTESDTEVKHKVYGRHQQWMANDLQCYLVRDRCGEKPLFIASQGDALYFSEISPLMSLSNCSREIDNSALGFFLNLDIASQVKPYNCYQAT